MRVLITLGGIQDYIFDITERKAAARLRGRSARLGLVIDLCLLRLQQKFGNSIQVIRNAGSRLEVETPASDDVLRFVDRLRRELDEHSHRDFNGRAWFTIACGNSRETAYKVLDEKKLSPGKAILQSRGKWDPSKFVFTSWPNERALQNPSEAEAVVLPEALLGRELVVSESRVIAFRPAPILAEDGLHVLDYVVEVLESRTDAKLHLVLQERDDGKSIRIRKRLARYAPMDNCGHLLDLDKIAERSLGAKFLGVLKADLDQLGETFKDLNEIESKILSDRLEELFTDELENLIRNNEMYKEIYVVYSGGDDLFLLGPWDRLIRFVHEFHIHLRRLLEIANRRPTLSAGFKLAHPNSPVRFLAEDVDRALDIAKGREGTVPKLTPKNRIAVFERVITWDELGEGLKWADRFIEGVNSNNLSIGFLQRLQYYADQFRQFFDYGRIDGLRALPLLQDDWHRNLSRVEEPLKTQLADEIQPNLIHLGAEGERTWRFVEFASRFAVYALR